MPVPTVPVGGSIPEWQLAVTQYLGEVEIRLAALENPGEPMMPFTCLAAELPSAPGYIYRVAYLTDTKILVVSDGTVWRRQDTGAAI